MERLKRMGFIVDLKPDLQLAECCPGVYLGRRVTQPSIRAKFTGSQDVAADLAILKNGGITHIINVATGIQNFFPKQFRYYNLELLDLPTTDIQNHLHQVIEYINEIVVAGGKVTIPIGKTKASGVYPLQCGNIPFFHLCFSVYHEIS